MGVYIKGMEMPKEPTPITIYPDGKWADYTDGSQGIVIEVSTPHGRLIDVSQKIQVQIYDEEHEDWYMETRTIDGLLSSGWVEAENITIIPAEEY